MKDSALMDSKAVLAFLRLFLTSLNALRTSLVEHFLSKPLSKDHITLITASLSLSRIVKTYRVASGQQQMLVLMEDSASFEELSHI